jgi:hypothetical protein
MARSPLSRRRRIAVWALIVLAALITFLSVITIWAKRQALETDNWVDTSSKLLEDDQIRSALSLYLVDQLYKNVDVRAELQAKLPKDVQPLAGPLAGALRELSVRAANELLSRPAVQALWKDANREAHEALIRIIDGKSRLVGESGDVRLDLRPLVQQLGERLGISARLEQRLGPNAGEIVIMHSDQLDTVQKIAKIVRALSIYIALAVLALLALAVYLARGWRRETLRNIGFMFVVVGVVLLVVRRLLGNWVVDALTKTEAGKGPANDVWQIGTSLLVGIAWTVVIYGLVLLAAAWLAGPTRPAVWVRRELAPSFREHVGLVYSLVAVAYLLLCLWGPTPAFRQPIWILVFAVLIALGVEAFRRLTLREFPAGSTPAR